MCWVFFIFFGLSFLSTLNSNDFLVTGIVVEESEEVVLWKSGSYSNRKTTRGRRYRRTSARVYERKKILLGLIDVMIIKPPFYWLFLLSPFSFFFILCVWLLRKRGCWFFCSGFFPILSLLIGFVWSLVFHVSTKAISDGGGNQCWPVQWHHLYQNICWWIGLGDSERYHEALFWAVWRDPGSCCYHW